MLLTAVVNGKVVVEEVVVVEVVVEVKEVVVVIGGVPVIFQNTPISDGNVQPLHGLLCFRTTQ